MNEAYCRDISIKTRSSLDIKRRNGDFVGAFTVYGYIKSEDNKNRLEIDPYAANIVRTIFRMRLEGSSASRIASELNRLCILSPLAYKKNKGFPYAKGGFAGQRGLQVVGDNHYPHFEGRDLHRRSRTGQARNTPL
jgi:hypothetical protein